MKKLLVAQLSLLLLGACAKSPPPPSQGVSVSATKALICNVPLHRDYVGHITAFNTVKIVPQVQGFLTNLYFNEGQEVGAGELLATIDARPYRAALAQAEAVLAQNIALLKYSEDTVERYAKLVQNDFVSQQDFDNYVTNVLSNEAIIKQNIAAIESAKLNVEYCYLRAPMNAVAGIYQIDQGNFIAAGSTSPIVTLNQIQPIKVYFSVPEDDLAKIRPLQAKSPLTTRIFLEGDTNTYHDGSLYLINNQVDESTGSILFEARLPNDDKALWPGQFATVRLYLEEAKNVVVIPSQALQISQSGYYVFVIKEDMTAELRTVKKGDKIGEQVIITSGLSGGETVVVEGQFNLTTGIKVKINNELETIPTFDNGMTPP